MPRKKRGEPISGWVNLNKPAGIGSTQALAIVKRALNAQKAGHAGTLDPLADGILPIALGEATKTIPFIQDALKTYRFTVTWGEQRTTDDAEGTIIASNPSRPAMEDIKGILGAFIGDISQIPPQFSAVKIDGERAYDIARDGDTADVKPRIVYIETLDLLSADENTAVFECICGKGTYIRSLARDMGLKLGCFGYISALTRTAVGPLTLENAISLDFFKDLGDKPPVNAVLPVETVLDDIPALALRENEASRLKHGNALSFIARPDMDRLKAIGILPAETQTALALFEGRPLAIVQVDGPDIKALRILNL